MEGLGKQVLSLVTVQVGCEECVVADRRAAVRVEGGFLKFKGCVVKRRAVNTRVVVTYVDQSENL